MVDIIFTHNSTESALKTRDLLHECLKGCDAYVNNDIILSDSDSEHASGEMTFKFKRKDGTEAECEHCIALLIAGGNENKYRHVIYVSDTNDLFPTLDGLSISLEALTNGKEKGQNRAKWINF